MPGKPAVGAKDRVPIARPPRTEFGPDVPDNPMPVRPDEPEVSFWSVETLKGFATSLVLHSLLLIVAACWYFSPPLNPPRVIDTRMTGSDMGVADGLSATGGLNAELEMPQGEPEMPEPVPSPLSTNPIEVKPLAVDSKSVMGAEKPTGGGGMKSDNPGAGNGDGFGLAKFGSGGENIHGVEVKVGDPQFTLIWDNDVDLDLHVIEPGGKEIYWEEPKGKVGLGGELDVDNTKGFGPENVYWLKEDENGKEAPGPGPPGEYKWFVVYWGGFGGVPKPTRWKVRIKHDGKVTVTTGKFRALNERSKIYTLKVESPEHDAVDKASSPEK